MSCATATGRPCSSSAPGLTMRHGLHLSRQAISQHLDVLESAGLVVTSREGRYKFHFIELKPLKAVTERWRGKQRRRAAMKIHSDECFRGRSRQGAEVLH